MNSRAMSTFSALAANSRAWRSMERGAEGAEGAPAPRVLPLCPVGATDGVAAIKPSF